MDNLLEIIGPRFFPTSKFNNDFNNPDFILLKERLSLAANELAIYFPDNIYSCSVNTGKGRIAGIPWIGFHARSQPFDSSSTTGIYVAILWHFDGKKVSLSLQKGTDESPVAQVKGTVEAIRKRHGIRDFAGEINLGAPAGPGRPRNYEVANIAGLTYSAESVSNLVSGLQKLEGYYSSIVEERLERLKFLVRAESEEINYQALPKLRKNEATSTWVRDPKIRDAALGRSEFKCEGDNSHITFQVGGNCFMEGHHLVPMEFQSRFPDKSLDFIDNIYSLCPNCHRKIHFGERLDRLTLVRFLFEQRQDKLKSHFQDYEINQELVLSFYEDF